MAAQLALHQLQLLDGIQLSLGRGVKQIEHFFSQANREKAVQIRKERKKAALASLMSKFHEFQKACLESRVTRVSANSGF